MAPGPGRRGLVEHEYRRLGTLAYLAAMDVQEPQRGLSAHARPKISNDAFDDLVAEVMRAQPYASARSVFWVLDNGTIHRGQAAIDRLQHRWPHLVLVRLPKHGLLAKPDRDLLLNPRPQSADTLPLRQPRPTHRADPWLPDRVQEQRHTV